MTLYEAGTQGGSLVLQHIIELVFVDLNDGSVKETRKPMTGHLGRRLVPRSWVKYASVLGPVHKQTHVNYQIIMSLNFSSSQLFDSNFIG